MQVYRAACPFPQEDTHLLAGVVSKSVTLTPKPSLFTETIIEVPGGLLNRVGLSYAPIDPTATIISIAGESQEEYEQLALRFKGWPLEVNLSCPNAPIDGKAIPGHWAKVNSIEAALQAEQDGASAVVLSNSIPAMRGDFLGGLSGPCIKPIVLRMVYETAKRISIPIIACGGISSAADAKEYLSAGAQAIQVATACYKNPRACVEILQGL